MEPVSFDELVTGGGPIAEAVTRRENARHVPQHALPRARRSRVQRRPWPYRWHLVLGVLTGTLMALALWPYALILWVVTG